MLLEDRTQTNEFTEVEIMNTEPQHQNTCILELKQLIRGSAIRSCSHYERVKVEVSHKRIVFVLFRGKTFLQPVPELSKFVFAENVRLAKKNTAPF